MKSIFVLAILWDSNGHDAKSLYVESFRVLGLCWKFCGVTTPVQVVLFLAFKPLELIHVFQILNLEPTLIQLMAWLPFGTKKFAKAMMFWDQNAWV